MKKERSKRVLAFLLAVIFMFSTCLTASPYTILAANAGPGTEGSETDVPSAPETQVKLYTEVVLADGVELIEGTDLGEISLKIGQKTVKIDTLNSKKDIGTYVEGSTYSLDSITASNYEVSADAVMETSGEDRLFKVTITKLTPVVKLSGKTRIKALAEESYSAEGVWEKSVTNWKLTDNTAKAEIVKNGSTVKVKAAKGGSDSAFTLEAYAGKVKLAEKTISVEKNDTRIEIETSKRDSWRAPLEITIRLLSGNTPLKKTITYSVTGDGVIKKDNNKSAQTDDNGKCEISKVLKGMGKVTVTADFAGDEAYNAADQATATYNPDLQKEQLVFTESGSELKTTQDKPLKITYGTEGIELGLELKSDDAETNEALKSEKIVSHSIDYGTELQQPVVDAENKKIVLKPVKVTNAGYTARVSLKVTTENYECTGTVYVQVDPCPLVIDEITGVGAPGSNIFNNEKTYDGTPNVDVKVSLKAKDEEKLTNAAKTEIAEFGRACVFTNVNCGITKVQGDNEKQEFTFTPPSDRKELDAAGISANYVIEGTKTAELAVMKRPLSLKVAETYRAFRSLNYIKPLNSLVSVAGFVNGESEKTLKDFDLPSVIDTTAEGCTDETVKTSDTATYGYHADALILDEKSGNPTGNYCFDFTNYQMGNITITEENNAEGYVSIDNGSSIHAFEKTGESGDYIQWYLGQVPTVMFNLAGGYNKIYLKDGTDITNGLTSRELASLKETPAGETIEKEVYLTKENDDGIVQKTHPFTLTFVYDPDAPECNITVDGKSGVISNLAQTITFNLYKNNTLKANVDVSDKQSGVRGWSYYVADTSEDKAYKELLDEEDYAEQLVNEKFTSGTDNGEITVGKLKEDETIQSNNYIVFIKTVDNVGNVRVYGSNGVVIDNFKDVTISYTDEMASNVSYQTVNGVNYVSGDHAKVTIAAEEAGNVHSGLQSLSYEFIYHSGDKSKDEKNEGTVKNEFPDNVTLSNLEKYCKISKELELKADGKSQIIQMTATATDNAGNTSDEKPHTIVLDPVDPVVTSSFEQANNNGLFSNESYANSKVTYAATVTERFLKEENLLVYVNGTGYTLDSLENNKDVLGIASVEKDKAYDIGKTNDESTYYFRITFDKDGIYEVYTVAKDLAGNTGTDKKETPFTFVIDTVRPELAVTYTAHYTDGTEHVINTANGRVYAGENVEYITAAAEMTETNFAAKDIQLTVTAENSKNEPVEITDYAEAATNGKNWIENGTVSEQDERPVYQITLPVINTDANYTFTWAYTDLAGNKLENTQAHELTLDRVRPTGEVTVQDFVNGEKSMSWSKLLQIITFGLYGKDKVTASMTGEDETAGIASMKYLASDKALTRTELEKKADTDWKAYTAELKFSANQKLIVYEKLTDKAGNTEYFSTDGIIVDNTKPVPSVKIIPTQPKWGKGVYSAKDKPGFDVVIEDPEVNGVHAGLKKITYRIVNGTNGHTETGTLADENKLTRTTHLQKWTGHVNIDPAKFYSNDVRVTVTAEDWSTNGATSKAISIKVDNKAPIVKFTFDKGDVHNGKYYKNDKKLTITVDERNFDESYMPKVTSSAGGGYKISKWTHHGETHTATITFTKDSDYTVSYDCYDLAGNKSNTEKLEEFTVDKTAPVIRVAYDNNSALNNSYYKASRTATITVTEHNFDPAKITAQTTASAGGAPKISGWSNKGDTHTARVAFDHDADYTFSVSGLDLAENKANDYGQDRFTVDLTNPEIVITGVEDKSANSGTVAPVVTIRDTNFITSGAKVTLTGANRGEQDIKSLASTSASATGMTVKFRDFAKNMDDIYTLTAESSDKAGNQTITAIQFSVNRDGSTYEISEKTQKLLEKGYTSVPQDIELTEINPDELTMIEISYSLDGKVVKLKEGTDYTVSKSGEESQWKRYAYKINASCFEAEGNYVINIYSEDAAKNVTTNKTKAKTIAFAVDKTAPTMVVSNLKNGEQYMVDNHEFTLNVKDNIQLASVELYIDGKLAHTYEGDELTAAGGELHIDITRKNSFQTIELVSYDTAGNSCKEVYDAETDQMMAANYRVLVTADKFTQLINSIYFKIGLLIVVAAVIFFIILLIRRRNKDKDKK